MTEEQKKDIDDLFDAMGKSGGRFIIGQVVGSQTNYIGDQFVPKNVKDAAKGDNPVEAEEIPDEEVVADGVVTPDDYEDESPEDNEIGIIEKEQEEESELNFATPRIVLQNMLKAENVRPLFNNPQKYTQKWTDQFISSLMSSEYGAYIAKKWAENDQRQLLKGYIFGLLSKAGVLKGSKLSIARACLNISAKTNVPELKKKVNTFSSYMSQSRWKDEPYADWVLEHIGGYQEEA